MLELTKNLCIINEYSAIGVALGFVHLGKKNYYL
jgi:hypothetical protein